MGGGLSFSVLTSERRPKHQKCALRVSHTEKDRQTEDNTVGTDEICNVNKADILTQQKYSPFTLSHVQGNACSLEDIQVKKALLILFTSSCIFRLVRVKMSFMRNINNTW